MTLPASFSPSAPEFVAVVASLLGLAWWIGVPYMLWRLLKGQKAAAGDRFRGEAVFVEAVVDDDGVLRGDLELGPRWAGRPVRVVVEPLDRV